MLVKVFGAELQIPRYISGDEGGNVQSLQDEGPGKVESESYIIQVSERAEGHALRWRWRRVRSSTWEVLLHSLRPRALSLRLGHGRARSRTLGTALVDPCECVE